MGGRLPTTRRYPDSPTWGRAICQNLLEQEQGIDPERRDFLGLLVRQLGDLGDQDSSDRSETDLDIGAWQRRLTALTGMEEAPEEEPPLEAGGIADESAEPAVAAADEDDQPPSIADVLDDGEDNAGLLGLDADLRAIFVEEFGSHLHKLREQLNFYRLSGPGSSEARDALQEIDDTVHTLSGNCRNLGFDSAADCAELAASKLVASEEVADSDRSPDLKNGAMARFAEALILLGQVRQQVRGDGQVNGETDAALQAFVSRNRSVPDAGVTEKDGGCGRRNPSLFRNLNPISISRLKISTKARPTMM